MKRVFPFMIAAVLLVPSGAMAKVEVKPYGLVLVNNVYNTDSPAEGLVDIPVFAPRDGTGEATFLITPRQSRFGVRMNSEGKINMSGALEIDFWGLRGSELPSNATQTAPRLRRAVLVVHFGNWDLLVGQEWIVFSPLKPTTLMHQSVTGLSFSGNLWARLPQIAGKFRLVDTEKNEVNFDVALTRPFGADQSPFPVRQFDMVGAGERSQLPFLQSRLAYVARGEVGLDVGVGVHAGTEDWGKGENNQDITAATVAFGADLTLKVGKVTVQGEGYTGKNIRMLFSSIGFKPDTTNGGQLRAINEGDGVGGWGEIKVAVSPQWDLAAGAGVESLDDKVLEATDVKQNLTVMGTGIWKPAPEFKTAVEVGWIQTKRIVDSTTKATDAGGTNLNLSLSFLYAF